MIKIFLSLFKIYWCALFQTQHDFNFVNKPINILKQELIKALHTVLHELFIVELLGISIDKALNFKNHIENLCRTAQYRLHALRRIRKYLTLDKAKLLVNAFIDSQFNYAPRIWLFCYKTAYWKMQKIHQKTLKYCCYYYYYHFFKVDFYITFYNYRKPINVNLLRKLEKNSDTKRFANSLI